MCNIHASAYIIVIEFLILKIFDGQDYCGRQLFSAAWLQGTRVACITVSGKLLEASQCVLVSFHICKQWALKGLPSIITVLRRGSGGKFSSEAAAATSSHSGRKDRAGSPWADFPVRGSEHTAPHPAARRRQTQTVCGKISLVSCLWCSVTW